PGAQRRPYASGVRRSARVIAQAVPRPASAAALLSLLAALLSACGSATHTPTTASSATSANAARATGTATSGDEVSARAPAPGGCAGTVASTLGEVGERIYREAGTGGNVEQAVHRVQSSTALANAIAGGD